MTTRRSPFAATLFAAAAIALAAPVPGVAQSLFAPAARVNEGVVTNYEVDQRKRMLELFRSPDPTAEKALEDLIDERLQLAEARRTGITLTGEELLEGMSEFAGRADLTREEFVAQLAGAGVEEDSFRDFVAAGLAWRQVVQERFGGGRTFVAADEVERAADGPPDPDLRVLLNEIIIPANTPDRAARAQALAPQISAIRDFGAFAAAARAYSATPSRARGGAIDWLELNNLPPQIRQLLLALSPGEVTPPIPLPNALAFFQLRQLEELPSSSTPTEIDFAAVYLPGGQSAPALAEAARIAARADTCDDLYGILPNADPSRLQRDALPVGQIPSDVALELARLDPGETSTALTRANGQTLVMLMLCDRSYRELDAEEPDLTQVSRAIGNQRVAQKAENYLAELRANAEIVIE